jgi:hypothetical protein
MSLYENTHQMMLMCTRDQFSPTTLWKKHDIE